MLYVRKPERVHMTQWMGTRKSCDDVVNMFVDAGANVRVTAEEGYRTLCIVTENQGVMMANINDCVCWWENERRVGVYQPHMFEREYEPVDRKNKGTPDD